MAYDIKCNVCGTIAWEKRGDGWRCRFCQLKEEVAELQAALAAAHASRNSDDPEPADGTDEHWWWKQRQESGLPLHRNR